MGKVYLVGAGCGALELYTVKAMNCIQKADCLIYDQLVDKQILHYCPAHCETIYVGKIAHHHTLSQDKINELLVTKAKEYDCVVRLKGGDVYVFGRGGEEGEYLYNHDIEFEVVPGISSAIGGLAYAGIPVTHRGLSGGFQVMTGVLKQGEERDFDFSAMLDDYMTYIFLMSMAKKEKIVKGLLAAGKDPHTGCAIISHASMPNQRCIVGTLQTILPLFEMNPLPMPGIIVVGNSVKMHEKLNFFARKPLFGRRILVTTVGRDHYLKDTLSDLGADVTEIMTGQVVYLDPVLPEIKDNLVFTSKHGVIGFMKAYMKQYHDLRKLNGVRIISIGEKTNKILNQYGLNADYIASMQNGQSLNRELKDLIHDEEVYVVQGDVTSVEMEHHKIKVYTNQPAPMEDSFEHFDYGLFTCGSSVERILRYTNISIGTFISMGPATTRAINECYPDSYIIELEKPDKSKMAECILKEEDGCFIEEDV